MQQRPGGCGAGRPPQGHLAGQQAGVLQRGDTHGARDRQPARRLRAEGGAPLQAPPRVRRDLPPRGSRLTGVYQGLGLKWKGPDLPPRGKQVRISRSIGCKPYQSRGSVAPRDAYHVIGATRDDSDETWCDVTWLLISRADTFMSGQKGLERLGVERHRMHGTCTADRNSELLGGRALG